jgi:V8-like Glu-specific endopeptidase
MKKFSKIILIAVFVILVINSTVYSQESKREDSISVNPQYRISDSPYMRLTEEEQAFQSLSVPPIRTVENMIDPEDVEVYDVASGKVTRISNKTLGLPNNEIISNITPAYQGLLPNSNVNPETVFDPDGRVQVGDTTGFPWRSIVSLQFTFPDGGQFICSGAIIDNFHVLTAGHCVFDGAAGPTNHGGWATSIKVIPGLEDTYEPYSFAWATYMRSYTGWTSSEDHQHDWAVITLDRNIGVFTGWMGRMTAGPSSSIYTDILNTAGYPADKGGTTMWFDGDNGRTANDYNHWYYMDTYGGQSGSPVWRYVAPDRYILTVHAYGDDGSGSNHGTRLNQDKYDRIFTWVGEDTPPTDYADLIDDGETYSGFSPTTVQPGNSFQAWNDVRNIGTAASGGFYVAYYASTNNIISTGDYYIGSAYVSSISSFNWADSDFSGTFPGTIPPGTYYVGYIIDSGNNVAEFDEGNNIEYVSSTQLTVTWPLYVSISESPDPVTSGGTSLVTVHVTTTGGASVSGASVTVSTTGGSLSPASGTTDSSGNFVTTYTPPSVSSITTYTISSTATKTGHSSGSGSDIITVKPAIPLGEAVDNTGLVWTTGGNKNWFGQDAIWNYGGDSAQSGDILDNQNSSIQTTVIGPGTLNFIWKVSSEASWDYLRFYIDGVQQAAITGEVSWQLKNYNIASGTHTLKWNYTKDSISSSGSDAGWLDKVEFYPQLNVTLSEFPDPINSAGTSLVTVHVTAQGLSVSGANVSLSATGGALTPISGTTDGNGNFVSIYTPPAVTTPTTYTILAGVSKTGYLSFNVTDPITVRPAISIGEAVDNIGLTWTTGGNSNWYGEDAVFINGGDAAQSGIISNGQATWVQTSVTGPGMLNFTWKVSSEANYDFLRFYIDGVQQAAITGEVSWQLKNYNIASGTHTLKWNYSKDPIYSSGSDAGWLDRVEFSSITDIIPPIITNPAANQSDIPDDTDNIPLWGETARLNVTVTDASGVASVTVNLAQIGGPAAKPMTNIGGNVYSTTTNASAGTTPMLYNLTVTAIDTFGNPNTSVKIGLRVRKNGDTNGNNAVNIGDALRLANNVSYPGNPAYALSSIYAAEVSGNGAINIGDALRLANNVSYPGNPAYILK